MVLPRASFPAVCKAYLARPKGRAKRMIEDAPLLAARPQWQGCPSSSGHQQKTCLKQSSTEAALTAPFRKLIVLICSAQPQGCTQQESSRAILVRLMDFGNAVQSRPLSWSLAAGRSCPCLQGHSISGQELRYFLPATGLKGGSGS